VTVAALWPMLGDEGSSGDNVRLEQSAVRLAVPRSTDSRPA
jgi:hypothetical protein